MPTPLPPPNAVPPNALLDAEIVYFVLASWLFVFASAWHLRQAIVSGSKRWLKYVFILCTGIAIEVLFDIITRRFEVGCSLRALGGNALVLGMAWLFEERQWLLSAYEKRRLK